MNWSLNFNRTPALNLSGSRLSGDMALSMGVARNVGLAMHLLHGVRVNTDPERDQISASDIAP